ncbi:putative nuclease HARBI1 [Prorops nasuta]|uniref:putative nuclease HARBI1 n=1 Tax=Prorops nasuta TaxID=863751 RepID=UPI0034CD4999
MELKTVIATITTALLDLLNSSSSSSESDEEILQVHERHCVPRVRIMNYFQEIVPNYSENCSITKIFNFYFRITRNTFKFLLELLYPHLEKNSEKFGRNPLTPEKQTLIAIWVLSTPNSFRCVSDRFGVGRATAWRAVRRVVRALNVYLHKFINRPSEDEARRTYVNMERTYKFPNVIGAIDGTHIKIVAPKQNAEAYINRKGDYSIQLQVVCDKNLKFTHVYCGQVGSVHDMQVFKLSGFPKLLNENNFPDNGHILGDAAYSICKYIMVPFKNNGHLTEAQINYNAIHSSARMIVERSIGHLKGRWRSILDTLPMTRTDLIPRYVVACCILHNICVLQNDEIDINLVIRECSDSIENSDNTGFDNSLKQERIIKRNEIMFLLNN